MQLSRQAQRQLKALLISIDPDQRAQGRALLGTLSWLERLELVRWLLNPRRRSGRHVLSNTGFRLIELPSLELAGADLSSAALAGADLRGADLRDTNLDCADLRSADLRGADLRGATMDCTDLSGADLRNANLDGTDTSACWSDPLTRWT